VRNLGSGDVEMEIQGKPSDIDRFLFLIGQNVPYIRIDHMQIDDRQEIDEQGFFERF
jgi:acylphosphatase